MNQIKEGFIGLITSDLKKVRFLQMVNERKVGAFRWSEVQRFCVIHRNRK